MKPCELTAADIALFARTITEPDEYETLSAAEQAELEAVLSAVKAAASAYTEPDIETTGSC